MEIRDINNSKNPFFGDSNNSVDGQRKKETVNSIMAFLEDNSLDAEEQISLMLDNLKLSNKAKKKLEKLGTDEETVLRNFYSGRLPGRVFDKNKVDVVNEVKVFIDSRIKNFIKFIEEELNSQDIDDMHNSETEN
ncbi:hypothetical protein IKQ21_01065 [bacterium]|nr:hypothetical protein [bacterium]